MEVVPATSGNSWCEIANIFPPGCVVAGFQERMMQKLSPIWPRLSLLILGLWLALVTPSMGADAPTWAVPKQISTLLGDYCTNCHTGQNAKGNVRLTGLEKLPLKERLDLLNQVQEQLFFKMMPPTSSDQLTTAEVTTLTSWVEKELEAHHASRLADKKRYPDGGNYVDHNLLFSGKITEKPFTPTRRWLVSPQIFEERMLDLFQLEGRERDNMKRSGFYGITNPFILPDGAGVKYYDRSVLDGGHLLVLLGNAEWIATKQLQSALMKAGMTDKLPSDPKDKWYPKTTTAEFETIVLAKQPATEVQIKTAINKQFQLVLGRLPAAEEMAKYLKLTSNAINIAGNVEGLRQMLKAVVLESDFYYRQEFGTGKLDQFGRSTLTPLEAAYAISYALGDRGPDAKLLQAANEGKLTTKADYQREVARLLDDPNYMRGQVDKSLNGGVTSITVTHPRMVRFFREFFGYPMAIKVFKDTKRSGGVYANADRGSTQTPGRLIDEADQVVAWILEKDTNVFQELLTNDQYFVYHNLDNEKGARLIENWRQLYEILKDTDWKKNPEEVTKKYDAEIRKYFDPKGLPPKSARRHDHGMTRVMTHFENTFGKGRTPFTVLPWQHGNQFWYSPLYNLSGTPGRNGTYTKNDQLNYQPVQPFAVPNRKGILTHPAWLVAFSSNFHNNPVQRGRWIREKLLAGYVPDVPITVDAQVPDDPHKTFRERLEFVTAKQECMKCHQHMNPLGLPLEQFDDYGRFRTMEDLEHPDNLLKVGQGNNADTYKTKLVSSKGELTGTGDPSLDGPVADSFDLIDRLAKSDRVRQSIIRHAFRFFMGRNEMLSDSQTLIDADKAYLASGGSFRAVVISLLTSDSFIYRKTIQE
ncbi:MAG: DUF1588 domain-containing protein [Zavarzinella sp.]